MAGSAGTDEVTGCKIRINLPKALCENAGCLFHGGPTLAEMPETIFQLSVPARRAAAAGEKALPQAETDGFWGL